MEKIDNEQKNSMNDSVKSIKNYQFQRIPLILKLNLWIVISIFVPYITNFLALYRFEVNIISMLPIIIYLSVGMLIGLLWWKVLFHNIIKKQPVSHQLLTRLFLLYLITSIILGVLFTINWFWWQSTSSLMQWMVFLLLFTLGLHFSLYFGWKNQSHSQFESQSSRKTLSFGLLIAAVSSGTGLLLWGVSWVYFWGMIWFSICPIFIFTELKFPWEDDSSQIGEEFNQETETSLRCENFQNTGRNAILYGFFYKLAQNTYILLWDTNLWSIHFMAIILGSSGGFIMLLFINKLKIYRFFQRWGLIIVGFFSLIIPIIRQPILMYLIDIVMGIQLAIIVFHFSSNSRLYTHPKWNKIRKYPGVFATIVFLAFIADIIYDFEFYLINKVFSDDLVYWIFFSVVIFGLFHYSAFNFINFSNKKSLKKNNTTTDEKNEPESKLHRKSTKKYLEIIIYLVELVAYILITIGIVMVANRRLF
jgi:MFS family permease